MFKLWAFLYLEFKRFLDKRNLVIWLLIFLTMLFFVNKGINEHHTVNDTIQKFNQIQDKYFKDTLNYALYGRDGIKILAIPSAARIFFFRTVIPPYITAQVDSVVKVQVDNSMKGKSLVNHLFFGRFDVAILVLLVFTLLYMYYGYEILFRREFLEYLESLSPPKTSATLNLAIARYLVIAGAYLVMVAGLLVFIKLRGVEMTSGDITGILASQLYTLGLLLFFYIIGVVLGKYSGSHLSILVLFIPWLVLVLVFPGTFVTLVEDRFPGIIDSYQTELDKYGTMVGFEKKARDNNIKYDKDNLERPREAVKKFLEKDYPGIRAEERRLREKIAAAIEWVKGVSKYVPTMYYMYTKDEVSSCGYGNFLGFYEYAEEMQEQFVRFWIDRVYNHDPKEMVNFIRGEENIYRGKSRVPDNFGWAIGLLAVYCIILMFMARMSYHRVLYPKAKNPVEFSEVEIKLEKGTKYGINATQEVFRAQFLNGFFGRSRLKSFRVLIDGQPLPGKTKAGFLVLPNPALFPGNIKGKHLLYFLKVLLKWGDKTWKEVEEGLGKELLNRGFNRLDLEKKARILLESARPMGKGVYIFKDFLRGICLGTEITGQAERLASEEVVMIDLAADYRVTFHQEKTMIVSYRDGKYIIE